MALIIQYGSLFNGVRFYVQLRARERRPLWQKLDELIHCQLCLTTQLSLWLWAFPVWLYHGAPAELGVAGPYLAFLIVWMSEAALSLAAWDLCRLVGRGAEALVLRARQLETK